MFAGLSGALLCSAAEPAATPAAPRIKFETNFFDFGKVTSAERLTGSFKFKNLGNAELKMDSPQASCDCTHAKVTETVPPGGSGEVTYDIKTEHAISGQRFIKIHSNDPENPDVELTVQLDYTPLFETTPPKLDVLLAPGKDQVQTTFVVNRMDNKALGIDRLSTSEDWITAEFDASYDQQANSPFDTKQEKPPESTARVLVTVHRPKVLTSFFKAKVELWNGQQSEHAAKVVQIDGQIEGELTASPARMEWVLADYGNDITKYPEPSLMRTIKLKSALGRAVQFKKVSTDIKGLDANVVALGGGKDFDLIIKFRELPHNLVDGKVTVETSLDTMPKLEIPLHISATP
jgi:hypothetical protein